MTRPCDGFFVVHRDDLSGPRPETQKTPDKWEFIIRQKPSPFASTDPRMTPLQTWAELLFGPDAPFHHTLRAWARAGKISPRSVKMGSQFFCSPDARYFDPVAEKIKRMLGD